MPPIWRSISWNRSLATRARSKIIEKPFSSVIIVSLASRNDDPTPVSMSDGLRPRPHSVLVSTS